MVEIYAGKLFCSSAAAVSRVSVGVGAGVSGLCLGSLARYGCGVAGGGGVGMKEERVRGVCVRAEVG